MLEVARPVTEPYIEIEGTFWEPEGVKLERPEYVVPLEVIRHVVWRLDMDNPYKIGIDPMCGNGIFVAAINEMGGFCRGIELDKRHTEIARTTLSQIIQPTDSPGWVFAQTPEIVHGDCTKVDLSDMTKGWLAKYIYTSPDFRGILNGTLDERIPQAFSDMLVPLGAGAFMVIDSADRAVRDGKVVNPAAATAEYFERSGLFVLHDRVGFRITNPRRGFDDQFTELMFVRPEDLGYWQRFRPKPLSS